MKEPTPVAEATKEAAAPVVEKEPAKVEPPKSPVVEEPKTVADPVKVKPDVIEAKAESLRGLKVLGKIELPTEKKKSKPSSSDNDSKDKKKRPRKRILPTKMETPDRVAVREAVKTVVPVEETKVPEEEVPVVEEVLEAEEALVEEEVETKEVERKNLSRSLRIKKFRIKSRQLLPN